jgi:hypothetical protein
MRAVLIVAAVLIVVALLALPGAGSVVAQVPTATPIWLFGVPIILPTTWPGTAKTAIPISYTPAPNLNPLGLDIDSGEVVLETVNMKRALFDVMGVTGNFFNFVLTLALVLWAAFALIGIFKKTKRMIVAFRTGQFDWKEEGAKFLKRTVAGSAAGAMKSIRPTNLPASTSRRKWL